MQKTIPIIVMAMLCLIFKVNAQTITKLSGKVITASDNKPLPAATVRIKSGGARTQTNENGEFSINTTKVPDVLIISYTGYKTIEISFNTSNQSPFVISLDDDNSNLKEVEVVSTGYQNIPKERATGSFAQPNKQMYDARVSTDVISKLSGITSGLLFNSGTSLSRSGEMDLNIRGRSTIFANDQPLIVVDNFPYNGDLLNINPNDVESITVLKDAAAASIWGVRAGNGVIVITTKQGRLEQPLKISLNTNLTITNKPDLTYNQNQLNASNYIDLEQFLFSKGYYDADLNDKTRYPVISPVIELLAEQRAGNISINDLAAQLNTFRSSNVNNDLNRYFYQKAINQQYAINLTGGASKATYFFSAGYDKNLPDEKENSYQRLTLNTQNTFKPVKGLEITVGLNITQTSNRTDNTLKQISGNLFPYTRFVDDQGALLPISYGYGQNYIESAPAKGFLDWSYYPLKELGLEDNNTKTLNTRINTGLKYTFLKGLSGEVKYLYQRNNGQTRNYKDQATYYVRNRINQYSIMTNGKVTGYNFPLGATLGLSNSNSISNNVRGQLNYDHSWKKHDIAIIAGYELAEVKAETSSTGFIGYNEEVATYANVNSVTSFKLNPSGSGMIGGGVGIGGGIDRLRSSFANVAYTYNHRYTLSGSARIDGSNYFGVATNQKNVPLWSAGGKWAIDKENFYKLEWLPSLQLRATYGYNGNLDQSVTGVTTFRYVNNALWTSLPYAVTSNIGNPDLRWEKSAIANLGIDFGSKNNTISGSLDYFFKKGTDLIGVKNFVTNSGITSQKGNYSDMKGQGIDLSITTVNLNNKLKWYTSFLLSYATDKVTRYDIVPTSSQIVSSDGSYSIAKPVLGKPVFGLYSYKWAGLNSSTGNPQGFVNGMPSEEYATLVNSTPIDELIYSGSARPIFFGGINNRFTYKGFGLSVQVNYKFGYYFRRPTINYDLITASGSPLLAVNQDYVSRWMKTGDEKHTDIPSLIYPFVPARDNFYQYSQVTVERGDHIRLQDVSLSYEFSKSAYPQLPFNNLQLFVYSNNLGILWRANRKGLDPDAIPSTFDTNTRPAPRSISFGIKGSF